VPNDGSKEWSSISVGSWLDSELPSDVQLIAVRNGSNGRQNTEFVVSTLVFAAPHVIERRMMAVSGTLGQQGLTGMLNVSIDPGGFNTTLLKGLYTATHTNTHNFNVCSAASYEALLQILVATVGFSVDGRQMRFWTELLPPTEAVGDQCVVAKDSTLTPFNETDVFTTIGNVSLGYLNYEAWGEVLGRVAALWPHLVALQMDDFTHDVYSPPFAIFRPPLLARMTARMRSHSAAMVFLPVIYYSEGTESVLKRWPDLILTLDLPLYYFRNQQQGAGPCAAVECIPFWGPSTRPPRNFSRQGGCLAGPCATETAVNVQQEVASVVPHLQPGRKMLVGFYATGHSSLGSPDVAYVRGLPQLALTADASVVGVMSFTMLAPCGEREPSNAFPPLEPTSVRSTLLSTDPACTGNGGDSSLWLLQLCAKGCAIADAFSDLAAGAL
jgi:hypothetical protein